MTDDVRRDIEDAYEKHAEPLRFWTKRVWRQGVVPGARLSWKGVERGVPLWLLLTALGAIAAPIIAYVALKKG